MPNMKSNTNGCYSNVVYNFIIEMLAKVYKSACILQKKTTIYYSTTGYRFLKYIKIQSHLVKSPL